MILGMRFKYLGLVLCLGMTSAQSPKLDGDYSGVLGPLHLKLHLKTGSAGALEGTLDSVDQGAKGLALANIKVSEEKISFDVPSVSGKWHGRVSGDGATLDGSWSQGAEMPLLFQRDEPFVAASKPSRVDGIWLGTIEAGSAKLRLQLRVKSDRGGKEHCAVDSPDQGANDLPCDKVQFAGDLFSFEVPSVRGRWSGTLNAAGDELSGTWSQGRDVPLNLKRQATAVQAKKPEPPKMGPALAPLNLDVLKPVLDRDLAEALQTGELASSTGGGVTIGVLQRGVKRIFSYGAAKDDQLFEIGSVSKTFTGLILAQMAEQGKVKLNEPVRELLPPGKVAKPDGAEITLLDLATQHSGLPRMPDNFHPADPQDPYVDYRAANLYEFITKHGVKKPADAGFAYSNLGLGLLGQALANGAGMPYSQLLKQEVTEPLGMNDTTVTLSPEQEKRFATGHDALHHPAHAWTITALVGAGGIRSTASDMLIYLDAQLHPTAVSRASDEKPARPIATLGRALEISHELRADAFPGVKIALAWFYDDKNGWYWHNGATGGYSSYALFDPREDYAVVVLSNTSVGPSGSFADRLGEHVAERLSGKPVISLGL